MEAWLIDSDHGKDWNGNLFVHQIWKFGRTESEHLVRVDVTYDPGTNGERTSSVYAYLLGPDRRDTSVMLSASGHRWWVGGLDMDGEAVPEALQRVIDDVIGRMKRVLDELPQAW